MGTMNDREPQCISAPAQSIKKLGQCAKIELQKLIPGAEEPWLDQRKKKEAMHYLGGNPEQLNF